MMEIIDNTTETKPSISYHNIQVGTVFTCDNFDGCFVLKTYDGLIDLKNPTRTWPKDTQNTNSYRNYKRVHAHIVLTDGPGVKPF